PEIDESLLHRLEIGILGLDDLEAEVAQRLCHGTGVVDRVLELRDACGAVGAIADDERNSGLGNLRRHGVGFSCLLCTTRRQPVLVLAFIGISRGLDPETTALVSYMFFLRMLLCLLRLALLISRNRFLWNPPSIKRERNFVPLQPEHQRTQAVCTAKHGSAFALLNGNERYIRIDLCSLKIRRIDILKILCTHEIVRQVGEYFCKLCCSIAKELTVVIDRYHAVTLFRSLFDDILQRASLDFALIPIRLHVFCGDDEALDILVARKALDQGVDIVGVFLKNLGTTQHQHIYCLECRSVIAMADF